MDRISSVQEIINIMIIMSNTDRTVGLQLLMGFLEYYCVVSLFLSTKYTLGALDFFKSFTQMTRTPHTVL